MVLAIHYSGSTVCEEADFIRHVTQQTVTKESSGSVGTVLCNGRFYISPTNALGEAAFGRLTL